MNHFDETTREQSLINQEITRQLWQNRCWQTFISIKCRIKPRTDIGIMITKQDLMLLTQEMCRNDIINKIRNKKRKEVMLA